MLLKNVVITIGGILPEDLRGVWAKVNGKRAAGGGGAGQEPAAPGVGTGPGTGPGPGRGRADERGEEKLAAWIAQHGP
eukprot:1649173-Lingulodinium_polyedra.AAC.1